ncbi:MAG TPA: hypothetical protein VHP80_04635 [Candidatus Acidoferrum sp.]|nr:hypothetical protein [Candidatus Acidoferrum sp.]
MMRSGLSFLLIAVFLLLTASAFADNSLFVPSSDVTFHLSSEEKSYEIDEEVLVNYRITNISNVALYVPREWEATCPTIPHLWAWFEDHSGNHLVPGYAGSCFPMEQTIQERMKKEAVLLKPNESIDGQLKLDPKLFHLAAGRYRVEASLTGWHEEKFTSQERADLEKLGHPFLTGEVPASLTVILTGDLPDHPVDHRL